MQWGYTKDGRAKIFDSEVLPAGWEPYPTLDLTAEEWTERAKAEALISDDEDGIDDTAPVKRRGRPPKVVDNGENTD